MLRRFCQLFTIGVSLAISTAVLPAQAQYARFTRRSDTIHISGNTQLGGAATYEARVYLEATGGLIFNEWRDGEEDKLLGVTGSGFNAYSWRIAGYYDIDSAINIPLNQWHHIAYVYDGTEERLYFNGVLTTSRAANGSIRNHTDSNCAIGAILRGGVADSFIGLLDTVRVSDVARYSGNSFVPPTGDLTADANTQLLYNFNEPLGSTSVTDLSPRGNNGTFAVGFTGATSPQIVASESVVSIGGLIALQGTQNTIQPVDFTFRPITGSAFTRTATLNFAGGYTIESVPYGQYTVSIKGAKWLRKNITVNASTGNVTNANATLLAGDANNDNFADISDLLLLIAHYNKVSPTSDYSDAADFNCDGADDIADLLLLIANYNKQGNS